MEYRITCSESYYIGTYCIGSNDKTSIFIADDADDDAALKKEIERINKTVKKRKQERRGQLELITTTYLVLEVLKVLVEEKTETVYDWVQKLEEIVKRKSA